MNTKSYIASTIVALGIAYGNNANAQNIRIADRDFDNDRKSYATEVAALKDYNSKKESANGVFIEPMENGIKAGIRIRDFSWEGLRGLLSPVTLWDHDKKGELRIYPFLFHPISEGGALSPLNYKEWKENPGRNLGTLIADTAIIYGVSKSFSKNNNHKDAEETITTVAPNYPSTDNSGTETKSTPTSYKPNSSNDRTDNDTSQDNNNNTTPNPETTRTPGNGTNQGNQPELPVSGSTNTGNQPGQTIGGSDGF